MSDYTLNIPVEVIVCPICEEHVWGGGELEIPGNPDFHQIAAAVQVEIAINTEQAIVEHYRTAHALRYWLFFRTGWKRLLG